jgi:hypothetical protein
VEVDKRPLVSCRYNGPPGADGALRSGGGKLADAVEVDDKPPGDEAVDLGVKNGGDGRGWRGVISSA